MYTHICISIYIYIYIYTYTYAYTHTYMCVQHDELLSTGGLQAAGELEGFHTDVCEQDNSSR